VIAGAAVGGFATTALGTAGFVTAVGAVVAGFGTVAGFGGSAANSDPLANDTNATSNSDKAGLRVKESMEVRG
ncbi:MAG: hypothetical protein WBP11_01760, partial [Dokdonella sp.]